MPGLNWQKMKQMLSNILRLNFSYLKIIHIFHSRYHPKIIGHILKNKQKSKRLLILTHLMITHEITQLIIMKMKNRSHRYEINRSRSRHGHKYNKYKKCLSMLMCIKQHLSII